MDTALPDSPPAPVVGAGGEWLRGDPVDEPTPGAFPRAALGTTSARDGPGEQRWSLHDVGRADDRRAGGPGLRASGADAGRSEPARARGAAGPLPRTGRAAGDWRAGRQREHADGDSPSCRAATPGRRRLRRRGGARPVGRAARPRRTTLPEPPRRHRPRRHPGPPGPPIPERASRPPGAGTPCATAGPRTANAWGPRATTRHPRGCAGLDWNPSPAGGRNGSNAMVPTRSRSAAAPTRASRSSASQPSVPV